MYIYKINTRQEEDDFFVAESETFQISCSADNLTDAVNSLNGELAKEIILLMRKGKPIPKSCEVSLDGGIYMQVDADRLFRESFKSTMVRRQVSLPAWMDYKLRLYGTDVSKLLQKAARKEIKKHEKLD